MGEKLVSKSETAWKLYCRFHCQNEVPTGKNDTFIRFMTNPVVRSLLSI